MDEKIIIAIDGPAGAGKSTIAKRVAQRLGYLYIDTGAMYRALTLKAKRKQINCKDEVAVARLLEESTIEIEYKDGNLRVFLDKEDVSQEIRKPYISDGVSDVAKIKRVRELMTILQRQLAKNDDSVLEGRDIGTVVFPHARFKFFLDADFKERARRRYKQLIEKKERVTIAAIEDDLATRDKIDSTRAHAPLKKADDAIVVDSTNLSIDQVVDTVISWINRS